MSTYIVPLKNLFQNLLHSWLKNMFPSNMLKTCLRHTDLNYDYAHRYYVLFIFSLF